MKNAVASDSWPAIPTNSVSPIAAIAALIANRPVCSQKASAYCGIHSSSSASAIQPTVFPLGLDTCDLPRAEQPRRPPQQDREQHDVRDHVREPATEEVDVVLIAGRELLRDADDEAADERA